MAKMRVHHWIASLNCEVEGPAGPHNHYRLFGVGYTYFAPPETEFPWVLEKFDLFARFYGGTGTRSFEVQLDWFDAPARLHESQTYGPFRVAYRSGEPTRDYVFRLVNVRLPGPGRYRARLFRLGQQTRKLMATEFIDVRHLP
jgi:hypothetical protein